MSRSKIGAWQAYLDRHQGASAPMPPLADPGFNDWQRFMMGRCLDFASAIGMVMSLPVGRLRKGSQLAHAFVILPNSLPTPDKWSCLDWSGVRTLKRVKQDMHEGWGRLTFDYDDITPLSMGKTETRRLLRLARSRPHIAQAMRLAWPRVSTTSLSHHRLRYLDVIEI